MPSEKRRKPPVRRGNGRQLAAAAVILFANVARGLPRRPNPVVVPPRPPVTSEADVVRFLDQATWGPDATSIARVRSIGIPAWLVEQFHTPPSGYPTLSAWPDEIPASCGYVCQRDNYSMYLLQRRFFTNALFGNDQLRQRVAWALHKLLVVSGRKLYLPSSVAPYLQILDRNAFGNYRTLLSEITRNPGMATYLDSVYSTRYSPNENYAREILQLFSIGTVLLNVDGTPSTDSSGVPIAAYNQSTITNFAKVFTGWRYASPPDAPIVDYINPTVLVEDDHDASAKVLLRGLTLPAGQPGAQDLNAALDDIFQHPNVGPYVGGHLIRSLVTSNPSRGYVGRVAAKFNDNGSGVRGDMQAVVSAVLLDPEARGDGRSDPAYGRLREPVQLVLNLLRAVGATSASGAGRSDGNLAGIAHAMGQDVFLPKTVFGYFPAGYFVPGSTTLRGPEFGVVSSATAIARINAMDLLIFQGLPIDSDSPDGTSLDLLALRSLASDPSTLVRELDRILLHGAMSNGMRDEIVRSVSVILSTDSRKRAQHGLFLVVTSSQYQVER